MKKFIYPFLITAIWFYFLNRSGADLKALILFGLITILLSFYISNSKKLALLALTLILLAIWKYLESGYTESCSFLQCSLDLSGAIFLFGVPISSLILSVIQFIQRFLKNKQSR